MTSTFSFEWNNKYLKTLYLICDLKVECDLSADTNVDTECDLKSDTKVVTKCDLKVDTNVDTGCDLKADRM